MSTQLDDQPFEDDFFQQNLPQYYRVILKNFRKASKSFLNFNLLYLSFFSLELFLFFFFLPFLTQSAIFAFSLGGFFLTIFSYFVLLFYHQAKKPEQLVNLKDEFITSCRQILSPPEGEAEHHLALADALSKLAVYLSDFEGHFYKFPKPLSLFSKLFSALFSNSLNEDVFQMKKLLLEAAVVEHIKQIKVTPTDLEVHASLANTYVTLSKIYETPKHEEAFLWSAKLAIEEFQILSNYAPNDPWVHEQLAKGYRDLKMFDEEMKEVETLLQLRSRDKEVLYHLGTLYFNKGMNAKGLQVYEELKKANYKKAEDLIASYGDFS